MATIIIIIIVTDTLIRWPLRWRSDAYHIRVTFVLLYGFN